MKEAISAILVQLGWKLVPEPISSEQHTANFRVLGMTCASCVAALEGQVQILP